MREFILFVAWLVEICPLQDVENSDTKRREKIKILCLLDVIYFIFCKSINLFIVSFYPTQLELNVIEVR